MRFNCSIRLLMVQMKDGLLEKPELHLSVFDEKTYSTQSGPLAK